MSVASTDCTVLSKDKDLFLDSPLFKNKQKSRIDCKTKTTCKKDHLQVSFIPSYVTLRKKLFNPQPTDDTVSHAVSHAVQ